MNELNGPHVVIVLGVREGRGFNFLEQPLLIEASLKGHKIQADLVDPSPNPMVCTELVWETEKKEVRKLRSSHVPLRIDCSCVDPNGQREKLGFILLSLRSAAAVTSQAAQGVEARWHRLVSVPSEYRVHKPELSLTLTLRDKVSPRTHGPSAGDKQEANPPPLANEEDETTVIPIIYLEEGFIQIGTNSPLNEKYYLSFILGVASNMDLLLTEDLVFNQTNDKLYLSLSLLGLTVNTKYFSNKLHEPVSLNEKIVFKLITNSEVLNLFMDEFKTVPLNFNHGTQILASADISLTNFLDNEKLEMGLPCKTLQSVRFVQKDVEFADIPENRIPCISTETILEIQSKTVKTPSVLSPKEVTPSISNESVDYESEESIQQECLNACGDQIRQKPSEIEKKQRIFYPTEDAAVQTTPRQYINSQSSLRLKQSIIKVNPSYINADSGNYRLYNLMITFRSITWRKALNIEGFQFKFQHPKAQRNLIINCDLERIISNEVMTLEDVYCIMFFMTTKENIKNLIAMYPPMVSLQNYSDENIVDDFMLYTKLLLQEGDKCDYFVVLNKFGNKDELTCDLQVEMNIKELSSGFSMKYDESEFNLDPIIIDDWLALKTVKDLEEWKRKQEILFKDNLKRLECEKIELLQAEWNLKRIELETKLQQGMEKCKVLSEELSKTAQELKLKQRILDEKMLTSPQSRENIEIKVTQMLEEEMNRNVTRIEGEKQKLMEKIEELQAEKCYLDEKIRAQNADLEEMRKTTLTHEQTARLLQELRHLEEKFEHAQMEKTFFKQQWHNALKEVHALKAEDHRQMQEDIQRKKEELTQLSLDGDSDSGDGERTPDSELISDEFRMTRNSFY